jgi:hypothetical protein
MNSYLFAVPDYQFNDLVKLLDKTSLRYASAPGKAWRFVTLEDPAPPVLGALMYRMGVHGIHYIDQNL